MNLFSRRLTQTVTLHLRSAGAEDVHGVPAQVETDQDVPGFMSQQVASESQQETVQREEFRLFLEASAPITGWDACTVDGLKYEVVGPPWNVFNPRTASVHHVEANVRRAGTDGT